MAAIDRLLGLLARLCAYLAAAAVCLMVLHTALEVVLRNVFSTSTFVLPEFVGYAMAASIFLALPLTFRDGALIRVHLLLAAVPPPARRLIEIGCAAAALVVAGYLFWFYWLDVQRNLARGATSDSIIPVPLWMPRSLVLVGLAVFIAQLVFYIASLALGRRIIDSAGESQTS